MGTRSVGFGLRAKLVALLLGVSAALSLFVALAMDAVFRAELQRELGTRLLAYVRLGAASLDLRDVETLTGMALGVSAAKDIEAIEADAAFGRAVAALLRIRAIDPRVIRYVYLFAPAGEPGQARYVADADVLELLAARRSGSPVSEEEISRPGTTLDLSDFGTALDVLAEGRAAVEKDFVLDEVYGIRSKSGYAPVMAPDGRILAFLGIDMADSDARAALARSRSLSLGVAGGAILAALLSSVLVGSLAVRRILALRDGIRAFGAGDFRARAAVGSRDEIGELAESFNAMAEDLARHHEEALRNERERAEVELRARLEEARVAEGRRFLEGLPQGVLVLDGDFRVGGQYSRRLAELFGFLDSPAGRSFLDLACPGGGEAERAELAAYLRTIRDRLIEDAAMLDALNPLKEARLRREDGSAFSATVGFARLEREGRFDGILVTIEEASETAARSGEEAAQELELRLADLVRKLARELGKEVGFSAAVQPGFPEAGPELSALLADLVDNALYHGIEPPEERLARGKARAGRIELQAKAEQDELRIRLSDDGRGIDFAAVDRVARERGFLKEGQEATRAELTRILFAPGFSTAPEGLGGREGGLAEVARLVKTLGGAVRVETTPGAGTSFSLSLPRRPSAQESLAPGPGARPPLPSRPLPR